MGVVSVWCVCVWMSETVTLGDGGVAGWGKREGAQGEKIGSRHVRQFRYQHRDTLLPGNHQGFSTRERSN